jgi:hypothetical protein
MNGGVESWAEERVTVAVDDPCEVVSGSGPLGGAESEGVVSALVEVEGCWMTEVGTPLARARISETWKPAEGGAGLRKEEEEEGTS